LVLFLDVDFCIHPGHTAAAINGATLALIDAGIPMTDYVTCATAGFVEGTPILGQLLWFFECVTQATVLMPFLPFVILDLNSLEESSDSPELTVASLFHSKKISYLQVCSTVPTPSLLPYEVAFCLLIHPHARPFYPA
jgi:exosome complex component RRP41